MARHAEEQDTEQAKYVDGESAVPTLRSEYDWQRVGGHNAFSISCAVIFGEDKTIHLAGRQTETQNAWNPMRREISFDFLY